MSQIQQKVWENCQYANSSYYLTPEEFFVGYIGIAIVNITLAVSAIFLNSVTILVFYKAKKLKSISDMLLCFLAATDFLAGLLAMPFFSIESLLRAYNSEAPCQVFLIGKLARLLTFLLTFMTSILISLDRYVAIFHSYRYYGRRDDRKFALRILLTLWSMSIVLAVGSLATTDMKLLIFTAMILVVIFIPFSSWVHLRAFFVARSIQKQIRDEIAQVRVQEEAKRAEKDLKTARITAVILAVVCICYLPQIVTVSIMNKASGEASVSKAFYWTNTLIMANSVFNPLMYVWQMKWFKVAFKRIFIDRGIVIGDESLTDRSVT